MNGGKYSIKPWIIPRFILGEIKLVIVVRADSTDGEEVLGSTIQLPSGGTLRASQFSGESFPSSPGCQECVLMGLPVLHLEDIKCCFLRMKLQQRLSEGWIYVGVELCVTAGP